MRKLALVVVLILGSSVTAFAQGMEAAAANDVANEGPLTRFAASDVATALERGAPPLPRPGAEAAENPFIDRQVRRPGTLVGLYSSLAVLNALDVYSTMRAVENGAREVNPLVAPTAGSPGVSLAIKAGTTATTIYFAEKLWKRNRAAAIVTMVAVNAGTAAIVARNLRNAR
jgi:hypothetical protein